MAKLHARGRREWIRAERLIRQYDQTVLVRRAYVSDGKILENVRSNGSWSGWRLRGEFDRHRPIPGLRSELEREGWVLDLASGS